MIAAGGGGDAITSAVLTVRNPEDPQVIMTYSWDRLLVDPMPGPRAADHFHGLYAPVSGVWEVLGTTTPIPPAGSTLPRLAAELPVQVLLLDPSAGTLGLAEQITAAARYCKADALSLVDVGGDILTDGADPGLRSPLADQLALAACVATGIACQVLVTGAGLDGELPVEVIQRRLRDLHAQPRPALTHVDIEHVEHVFRWHPSEASGLLAAAANGHRGRVEVRDGADQVDLTDATTAVVSIDAERLAKMSPAHSLANCTTLDAVAAIMKAVTGISEIDYETQKALQIRQRDAAPAALPDLAAVDRIAAEARSRHADYISVRRFSELLGAGTPTLYAGLTDLLRRERPEQYVTSLYRTY